MAKGRIEEVVEVARGWGKRDRLRAGDGEARDNERDDQHHLDGGRDILKRAAVPDAGEMNQRHNPCKAQAQHQRRPAGEHALEVDAECHRRQRSRRGEPDCRRYPAGQETDGWMIDAGQEVILASRPRQRRCQLGIGECTAQRRHAAHDPQRQEREPGWDFFDLKA
jgi:hypothetical protein